MIGENENLLIKENNYTLHNLLHELSIFLNIIFRTPNKVFNLILYFERFFHLFHLHCSVQTIDSPIRICDELDFVV